MYSVRNNYNAEPIINKHNCIAIKNKNDNKFIIIMIQSFKHLLFVKTFKIKVINCKIDNIGNTKSKFINVNITNLKNKVVKLNSIEIDIIKKNNKILKMYQINDIKKIMSILSNLIFIHQALKKLLILIIILFGKNLNYPNEGKNHLKSLDDNGYGNDAQAQKEKIEKAEKIFRK